LLRNKVENPLVNFATRLCS